MKTLMPMRMALSAAVLSMLAIGGAKGANTLYAPGDLVLYFQQQGGANTVYVNVGNAATNFRGAAAGAADGGYNLNFINISTTLESAFGPNWASSSTVYAGMAGVWGGEPDDETLQNGDPSRTLYVSKARTSVGTVGVAGSSGWTVNTNTGMTNGAAGIYNQNNVFEQNYDVSATVSLAAISRIDENNPFTTAGSITIQGHRLQHLRRRSAATRGSGLLRQRLGCGRRGIRARPLPDHRHEQHCGTGSRLSPPRFL